MILFMKWHPYFRLFSWHIYLYIHSFLTYAPDQLYQDHIVGRPTTFESLLGMLSTLSNCEAIRWWPRSPDGSVEDRWTFAAAHEWNLANPFAWRFVGDQHGQVMMRWMTELVILGDVDVMQRELTGLGAGIGLCCFFFLLRLFSVFSVCLSVGCTQCSMFFEARVVSTTD